MFKSLFSKYISAFLIINIFSFAVIISIITSIINGYSQIAQKEAMKTITVSSCEYISSHLDSTDEGELDAFISSNKSSVDAMFSALSQNYEDITIVVCDDMNVVLSTFGRDSDSFNIGSLIPGHFVEYFETNKNEFAVISEAMTQKELDEFVKAVEFEGCKALGKLRLIGE